MIEYTHLINIIIYQAVKPNHNLQYDIGIDFCIEDLVNTSLRLTINCPLEREPQPPPQFEWNITLNGIELPYQEITIFGLSAYTENDTLNLNGTIGIGFGLNVTCMAFNRYGMDIKETSIVPCGKQ